MISAKSKPRLAGLWQGSAGRRLGAATILLGGSCMTGGCITLNAPDKPIVIELNIKIEQDVVYKLAPDVQQTVEQNKDIF
jgi:hypothetical protein